MSRMFNNNSCAGFQSCTNHFRTPCIVYNEIKKKRVLIKKAKPGSVDIFVLSKHR